MADERQPNLGLWAEPPQSEDALENFLRPMVWKLPLEDPERELLLGFLMACDVRDREEWSGRGNRRLINRYVESVDPRTLKADRRNSIAVLCAYGIMRYFRESGKAARYTIDMRVLESPPTMPATLYESVKQVPVRRRKKRYESAAGQQKLVPVQPAPKVQPPTEDTRTRWLTQLGTLITSLTANWGHQSRDVLSSTGDTEDMSPAVFLPTGDTGDVSLVGVPSVPTPTGDTCPDSRDTPHDHVHEIHENYSHDSDHDHEASRAPPGETSWNFSRADLNDLIKVDEEIYPLACQMFRLPVCETTRDGILAAAYVAASKGNVPGKMFTDFVKRKAWDVPRGMKGSIAEEHFNNSKLELRRQRAALTLQPSAATSQASAQPEGLVRERQFQSMAREDFLAMKPLEQQRLAKQALSKPQFSQFRDQQHNKHIDDALLDIIARWIVRQCAVGKRPADS